MANHIDSFTVPGGVTSLFVECWGGGGPGFNGSNSPYRGPGGGGGAYANVTDTVVPAQVISLLIPDTTASGDGSQAEYGRAGTATSPCVAAGGKAAAFLGFGAGGLASASTGDVKISGVDGEGHGVGDFVLAPGNPGGAGSDVNGVGTGGGGGAGGAIDSNGSPGSTPGGGGGGGGACNSGGPTSPGAGAAGGVRIWINNGGALSSPVDYGNPPPLQTPYAYIM